MRIFDLLEHWLPEYRARVFYEIENRWCWDCGEDQAEGDHVGCGSIITHDCTTGTIATRSTSKYPVAGESERETLAADRTHVQEQLAELFDKFAEASHTWRDTGYRTDAPDSDEYADRAASLIERGESGPTDAEIQAALRALYQDGALNRVKALFQTAPTPKGAVQGQGSAE